MPLVMALFVGDCMSSHYAPPKERALSRTRRMWDCPRHPPRWTTPNGGPRTKTRNSTASCERIGRIGRKGGRRDPLVSERLDARIEALPIACDESYREALCTELLRLPPLTLPVQIRR
jgi:hypothetical protein